MDYQQKYQLWLQKATHPDVVQNLQAMAQDEQQKQDSFYKDIEFGTAGMRGVMSAGTNRLNVYTVFAATTGVAQYMSNHGMKSCAITYDSRNNSKQFSCLAAATLASAGIKVFLTEQCMPTPFLSFMVRTYGADMGINITASHNAAQYNGYKVYDSDGCQILDEAAQEITQLVRSADPFARPLPQLQDFAHLVHYVSDEVEQQYMQQVLQQGLDDADGISVVYTPLNGAGHRIVPQVLQRAGVANLEIVPQQAYPDGNFPTCPYPNPEKPQALQLALQLAQQKGADAVVANDPDSDRMGAAVRTSSGQYRLLSGNEVGVLLVDYILNRLQQQGKMPRQAVVVKTIVSTPLANKVAQHYGAQVQEVLTGFKYIGNAIKKLQQNNQSFVFGFEESCGYLKGTYVRDKDGVVAAMLFCQCVAYYKKLGKALVDRLQELLQLHGEYLQQTFSYTFDGAEGAAKKQQLFEQLRAVPLAKVGNSKVTQVTDFLHSQQTGLPASNVLRYQTEEGSCLILRPSGTEPLVKCYVFTNGSGAAQKLQEIKQMLDQLLA